MSEDDKIQSEKAKCKYCKNYRGNCDCLQEILIDRIEKLIKTIDLNQFVRERSIQPKNPSWITSEDLKKYPHHENCLTKHHPQHHNSVTFHDFRIDVFEFTNFYYKIEGFRFVCSHCLYKWIDFYDFNSLKRI